MHVVLPVVLRVQDFAYELCVGQNGRVWLSAPTARETVLLLQVSYDFLAMYQWQNPPSQQSLEMSYFWECDACDGDEVQAIKRSFGMSNVQIEVSGPSDGRSGILRMTLMGKLFEY